MEFSFSVDGSVDLEQNKKALIEYLKAMDSLRKSHPGCRNWVHTSSEDLVLKNGRFFQAAPRPVSIPKMTDKECFKNAFDLASSDKDLTYAEGYGLSIIPTLHAWCVTQSGVVVDPTWKDPQNCTYYGVPLNLDFVRKTILRRECYGVFDDWQSRFKLLRSGLPKSAMARIERNPDKSSSRSPVKSR